MARMQRHFSQGAIQLFDLVLLCALSVRWVCSSGQVAGVGTYLRSVELSPDETKTLAKQTRDLACTSPHRVTQFVQVGGLVRKSGNRLADV